MPEFRLALISGDFKINNETGTYSIADIFERRYEKTFPTKERFFVIIFWDSILGEEFDQSITVLDSDSQVRVAREPIRIVCTQPKHMSVVEFKDIVFDEPGTYFIHIKVDGVLVEQVPIIIAE